MEKPINVGINYIYVNILGSVLPDIYSSNNTWEKGSKELKEIKIKDWSNKNRA